MVLRGWVPLAEGRTGWRQITQPKKQSSDVQSHLSVNRVGKKVCVTWLWPPTAESLSSHGDGGWQCFVSCLAARQAVL